MNIAEKRVAPTIIYYQVFSLALGLSIPNRHTFKDIHKYSIHTFKDIHKYSIQVSFYPFIINKRKKTKLITSTYNFTHCSDNTLSKHTDKIQDRVEYYCHVSGTLVDTTGESVTSRNNVCVRIHGRHTLHPHKTSHGVHTLDCVPSCWPVRSQTRFLGKFCVKFMKYYR
jgi:hypothetical protein